MPLMKRNSWPVAIAIALLATIAATVLRLSLIPLIGDYALPVTIFFPAVLVSAWYGGFRAGVLSILFSTVAAAYFFTFPPHSFVVSDPVDRITLLVFVVVGLGIALLSKSHRQGLDRADQQRQRFETTLASIGDGVIATDADGNVSRCGGAHRLDTTGGFG
jgi:K+-sensing histidine kinase KdpD